MKNYKCDENINLSDNKNKKIVEEMLAYYKMYGRLGNQNAEQKYLILKSCFNETTIKDFEKTFREVWCGNINSI